MKSWRSNWLLWVLLFYAITLGISCASTGNNRNTGKSRKYESFILSPSHDEQYNPFPGTRIHLKKWVEDRSSRKEVKVVPPQKTAREFKRKDYKTNSSRDMYREESIDFPEKEKRMPFWKLLLGLLPLLTSPLIGWWSLAGFSLYVLVLYFRKPLRKLYEGIKINNGVKFLIVETLFSLLVEGFVIIDNLPLPPDKRILFHPDPLMDLYLATGFYLAFAIGWKILLDRFDYDAKDVFILGGMFGIVIEQLGKIFLSFNPFLWLYVFLVYGAIEAMGVVVAEDYFKNKERKSLPFWKKFLLTGMTQFLSFIMGGGFIFILKKIAGL